jgi:hypothetical protein
MLGVLIVNMVRFFFGGTKAFTGSSEECENWPRYTTSADVSIAVVGIIGYGCAKTTTRAAAEKERQRGNETVRQRGARKPGCAKDDRRFFVRTRIMFGLRPG